MTKLQNINPKSKSWLLQKVLQWFFADFLNGMLCLVTEDIPVWSPCLAVWRLLHGKEVFKSFVGSCNISCFLLHYPWYIGNLFFGKLLFLEKESLEDGREKEVQIIHTGLGERERERNWERERETLTQRMKERKMKKYR